MLRGHWKWCDVPTYIHHSMHTLVSCTGHCSGGAGEIPAEEEPFGSRATA